MLRRQCFVLALGIVGSLVGTVRAQQSIMDDPFFAAGPPTAAQPPAAPLRSAKTGGSDGNGIITATNAGPNRSSPATGRP